MKISMLKVLIEVPKEKKNNEQILAEIVRNQDFINNFELNRYSNVDLFISKDDNRSITIGPKNTISIIFNPKNLNDNLIKRVEEELSLILKYIKSINKYTHLHQELHIHIRNIKLKFNPISIINRDEIKKQLKYNKLEVGMVGVKFIENESVGTNVTFHEKDWVGIISQDFESDILNILNKKNSIVGLLEPILEK